MPLSRRRFVKDSVVTSAALWLAGHAAQAADTPLPARQVAPGPFQPDWESLKQYQTPEWFRDAKFGIWAHWTAQCVPEQGDWYARQMYIQGHWQNRYHVEHYGHPSEFGFMELDNAWKADKWDPEALMQLYVKAGAKYFVALANHHDNFDCYDSRYHEWNSVRVGPKRDIVGTWAKVARKHGLRFGVTNHSGHAWHWLQTAYGYDPEGDKAGVRYDAFRLTKADSKGKWWEGLDPQQLYTGPNLVMPDGITTIKDADAWHDKNDRRWQEAPPANNPAFVDRWFLRCQDLLDRYHPDLLYFDNTELPLGQAGLDIAAHFYNANQKRHGGRLEAVLNTKGLSPEHRGTMVLDIERGRADDILPTPWQTDTCIGAWHYQRSIYEDHHYKTPAQVIKMLVDIVSKNGNLLLNIPLRGDGSVDPDELAFLQGMAAWMPINGEAIYGTRPWTISGEGPTRLKAGNNFSEGGEAGLTARDVRFTTKGKTLYATALGWPDDGKFVVRTLAANASGVVGEIKKVSLLGHGKVEFTRTAEGLVVTAPPTKPCEHAFVLKIEGVDLAKSHPTAPAPASAAA